ncbi:MAG: hydroxymethylbilane synthase [Deltaproteobacteria bacterium]|jgi:hydroxymethylbilane synthase|nr:hydroxymethylbilane synthase [Deltaproteobacteria bacterium]MBT6432325.1 hydroxymethylbilane synthase [Deltaproteobacteria bacterium]MBT6489866.1 hydroxymethylbilane synthase [Deltaproteobacteria bacterium]
MGEKPLIIGSRGSDLALWQANHVSNLIQVPTHIEVIKTAGDRIQHLSLDKVEGKGFFTKEIEEALIQKRVDIAVHSFKDLPIEGPQELKLGAIPPRAPVRDVVIVKTELFQSEMLWGLKKGARVGTSSLRRKAHMLSKRPDLEMVDIRGNVPTRLQKVPNAELDAVILAEAGLARLGFIDKAQELGLTMTAADIEDICPAPAQGALAIQIRSDDSVAQAAISALHDPLTAKAVETERLLLGYFGGGCHLPLGAFGSHEGSLISLQALVASPDGKEHFRAFAKGEKADLVAADVHAQLCSQGADRYLD